MTYVESENDRVLQAALESAGPNELATLANRYLGYLCNRWNMGFRPGGAKTAKWKRQLSGKQEASEHAKLHRKGGARYQTVPVKNTRTTEPPLLECHRDGDRVIRHHNGTIVYVPSSQSTGMYFGESISAMETLFWEMVADGTLQCEQAEYGVVHGYRRCVRRAFSRICKRAERERAVRLSSLDDKVSVDYDGVPITYGSRLAETETLLGRPTAEENKMLLAEQLVGQAEQLVVKRVAKKRHGRMLVAIMAYMAEGMSAQKIFGRIRENGTKAGKRSVERMMQDIRAECAAAIASIETDLLPDTEYEPVSERISADDQRRAPLPAIIRAEHEHNEVKGANRWTYPEYVEPNSRDVAGLVHFGHSLKYQSEIEREYKCSDDAWSVSDDALERYAERSARLDALCAEHGID